MPRDMGRFPRALRSSSTSLQSDMTVSSSQSRRASSESTERHGAASLSRQSDVMRAFDGSSSSVDVSMLFARERLQWLVFSGVYQERRYVNCLQNYRDVLLVDTVEKQTVRELKYVLKRCKRELYLSMWTGIKKTSDCVKLFVELTDETPFGHYWFLIRSVKFQHDAGLRLIVRCLRPVIPTDVAVAAPSPGVDSMSGSSRHLALLEHAITTAIPWKDMHCFVKQVLSWRSLSELAQFVSMVALLAVSALRHVPVWLLQLIDSSSLFVERCTPLLESLMQLVARVCGGLLILVARIWTDVWQSRTRPAPPPPTSLPQLPPPPLHATNGLVPLAGGGGSGSDGGEVGRLREMSAHRLSNYEWSTDSGLALEPHHHHQQQQQQQFSPFTSWRRERVLAGTHTAN